MPAPVAAFSGTPLSGVVPVNVTFTDASTNSPTSWLWDFGDGGSSTVQNPVHQYVQAGSYTVTLTATNASGSDPEVKAAYVVVTATVLTLVMDGYAALILAATLVENVYAWPKLTVAPPCAIVGYPTAVQLDATFASGVQRHHIFGIPIWFLADENEKDARDALSNILTGSESIKNALDGPHSFGTVRCGDAAIEGLEIGAVSYVGVRIDTEVMT